MGLLTRVLAACLLLLFGCSVTQLSRRGHHPRPVGTLLVLCVACDGGGGSLSFHDGVRVVRTPFVAGTPSYSAALADALPALPPGRPTDTILVVYGPAIATSPHATQLLEDWATLDADGIFMGCATSSPDGTIVQYSLRAFTDALGATLAVQRMNGFGVADTRVRGVAPTDAVDPRCVVALRSTWEGHATRRALAIATTVVPFSLLDNVCRDVGEGTALVRAVRLALVPAMAVALNNLLQSVILRGDDKYFRGMAAQADQLAYALGNVSVGVVCGAGVMRSEAGDSLIHHSVRAVDTLHGGLGLSDVLMAMVPAMGAAIERAELVVASAQRNARFLIHTGRRTDPEELGWHLCSNLTTCHVSAAMATVLSVSAPSYLVSERYPLLPDTPRLRIVWSAWCCHCCGFSSEIQHILYPLSNVGVEVYTTLRPSCFCGGAPRAVQDTLARITATQEDVLALHRRGRDVLVWVSHIDPLSFGRPEGTDYAVGRTMCEFTVVPASWVAACNKDSVDELWVPSTFVRDVFIANGVTKSIVVVPEAIDPHYWDRRRHRNVRWNASWRQASNAAHLSGVFTGRVNFITQFKWEPRKGWDILLDAYFAAFTAADSVSLYILTHVWFSGDPALHLRSNPHNASFVWDAITTHATLRGMPIATLPHIVVLTEPLSESSLAEVYRPMSAFVLPTHGEGWCLPVMQSMAMSVPVVTTRWSGMLDYLDDTNAWLIEVARLEDVPKDTPYKAAEGAQWAVPSVQHLESILRGFHNNISNNNIEERVRNARRVVAETYTEENIAEVIRRRLNAIKAEVVAKR